jgi:hypothetical protein
MDTYYVLLSDFGLAVCPVFWPYISYKVWTEVGHKHIYYAIVTIITDAYSYIPFILLNFLLCTYYVQNIAWGWEFTNFSLLEQTVNILGFVGYLVSVILTQLCHCSMQVGLHNMGWMVMTVF